MQATTTVAETEIPSKPPTSVRYWLILGLALASTCAYLSRVCLGTANTTIQRELGFSSETMGVIMSAFSVGYLVQVPAGALANRWGTRLVLPLLCVGWSAFAAWTGLAMSYASLMVSRLLSGLAQAGLVPCSAKGVRDWSPPAQRGIASSAIASSMSLGAVIAAALTAQLMPVVGWRGVFLIYAGVGLVWSAAFYIAFRNRPEEHPWVNESEVRLIRTGSTHGEPAPAPAESESPAAAPAADEKSESSPGPARSLAYVMFTSPEMWLICLQAFCRAFGASLFITWFPAYLEKGRGMQVAQAGMLSTLPLIGTLTGNLLGGIIVDRILLLTGSKWGSRCGTSAAALGLCAASLLAAAFIHNPTAAVIVIALGSACFGCGSPAAWAATMDIGGKHTALAFSIMNTAGNVGGFLCPILLGVLIGHIERTQGDWNLVLYLFAGIYVLGAIFWLLLNPNRSAVGEQGTA